MQRAVFAFVLASVAALAQSDANSVTVTVARTVSVPSDTVQMTINVNAPPTVDSDAIVKALTAAGVSSVEFISVGQPNYYVGPGEQPYQWSYRYFFPFSKLSENLAALRKAAEAIAANDSKLSLTFSPTSAPPSTAVIEDARRKTLSDLVQDARREAQRMADVSGLTLGVVLAVATPSPSYDLITYSIRPVIDLRVSLTVKFAASRY